MEVKTRRQFGLFAYHELHCNITWAILPLSASVFAIGGRPQVFHNLGTGASGPLPLVFQISLYVLYPGIYFEKNTICTYLCLCWFQDNYDSTMVIVLSVVFGDVGLFLAIFVVVCLRMRKKREFDYVHHRGVAYLAGFQGSDSPATPSVTFLKSCKSVQNCQISNIQSWFQTKTLILLIIRYSSWLLLLDYVHLSLHRLDSR